MRTFAPAVVLLLVVLVLLPPASAAVDCGYARDPDAESGSRFFPRDDVFRPPLADPKEPRFYAGYHRVQFRTGNVLEGRKNLIRSGFVGIGESIGLWTRRGDGCNGVQVSLFGAVFSQFDLSVTSGDLLNSDFLVGIPVTWRRGPWSLRGRLLHQSSHLGDELVVRNPAIRVKNFGYEMVDGLVSYEYGRLRGYGGLGVVFNSGTDFDPMMFQAGVEARSDWTSSWSLFGLKPTPVLGVDYRTWQQQDWDATWNVVSGLEFNRPGDTIRLRILGTLLRGHYPFAQFFDDTKVNAVGVQLQFEM